MCEGVYVYIVRYVLVNVNNCDIDDIAHRQSEFSITGMGW